MDVIHDVLDSHGSKEIVGWRDSLLEHVMWLLSRSLLILFIVGLAFAVRLPFQRLMGGEAVHEMEEAEKQRQLDEFKIVQQLSIAASKFQPAFADSARAVTEYERTRSGDSRNVAEVKLRRATVALDRFRDTFGNRNVELQDDLEGRLNLLIDDGESGLRAQNAVLSTPPSSRATKWIVTFDCNKTMIAKDVDSIANYERGYVLAKRESNLYGITLRPHD
jgi:hypothetical protein